MAPLPVKFSDPERILMVFEIFFFTYLRKYNAYCIRYIYTWIGKRTRGL